MTTYLIDFIGSFGIITQTAIQLSLAFPSTKCNCCFSLTYFFAELHQLVTALASLFLVSTVRSSPALISEPALDPLIFLDVCQPCGDVALQYGKNEMLQRIKMSLYREGWEVVNALVTAMNHAKVK